MSPIRASAYGEMMSMSNIDTMNSYSSITRLGSSSSFNPVNTQASARLHAPPVSKKRRSPNAFILFRSHFIANKRVPPEMVHQNDVSRYVAEVWKSKLTPSERAVFFKKAQEEKVRFEIEGPREPVKKRRNRSKKMSQFSSQKSTGDPCLPLSPGSVSDVSFAEHGTSYSVSDASPQSYSSLKVYPTPSYDDGSVLLPAPQPTHAIPPSLLNWGHPVENFVLSSEGQASTAFQYFTPAFSAADIGIESHLLFMDPDFNALQLDGLLSGMDMVFTEFSNPLLFESLF